ncbi:uncharacterized protein BP01DRAFT_380054 [Aspergillus saccharolyticus JOP 1030-1]|uniref:Uncharacterized protein n=1 Tax=Aspergillus saccharolyticus JOP 1030-1 TaxID=1450539 RepID=A0A318ZKN9_9EURO|nr:hypothetical protein BP01DRAFT_380054 [Aspergillus saccharolyticus JOP 1030-1]PYH48139.1 hypothetical protein BP01DRAFT_380054 [Aspergillus saccharolyticus JOP 1030-1]
MPPSTRVARRKITHIKDAAEVSDPIIEDTPAFRSQLEDLRKVCQEHCAAYRAPKNTWELGDPPPPKLKSPKGEEKGKPKGRDLLGHYRSGPLVSGIWDPKRHGWPPAGVQLTDAWIYNACKYLSTTERHDRYPADFDGNGMIRQSRVPCGPTFVIAAHGLYAYPIFKGYYVLCGEEGRKYCTWLLQRQRDAISNQFHFRRCIIGPVLPSPSLRPSNGSVIKLQSHCPGVDVASGPKTRLPRPETDIWTVFLNDMVLQYKKPDTYEIVKLASLKPRLTCTESPQSDKLVNRQVAAATASNTPNSKGTTNPVKQERSDPDTISTAPKKSTAASSPTDFVRECRSSSSSTRQTTTTPSTEPSSATGKGKVKRGYPEDQPTPARTPSNRASDTTHSPEAEYGEDRNRKRRRTSQDGQLLSGLYESVMRTKFHFDTFLASSREAEKRHEAYRKAMEQRQKHHNACVEAAIGTFNHIQNCVAYLQEGLGGSDAEGEQIPGKVDSNGGGLQSQRVVGDTDGDDTSEVDSGEEEEEEAGAK